MNVLGLDVSTTTCGWAIVNSSDMSLVSLGHWSLKKIQGLTNKADYVLEKIATIIQINDIKSPIWIEEPVMRFTPGMSSAQTISTLIGFNAMVSYGIHLKMNYVVNHISPGEARRSCGLKLTTKAKAGGKNQKEQVFEALIAPRGLLSNVQFALTKTGKQKPENYDETDAYVIARHGALTLCK